jgi:hypothetical protein
MRNAHNILVGKPEGKRPLGRLRCRMDLRETECEDVDWIHLAQDRDQWRVLVNTAMKFRVPLKEWNFLTS